MSVRGRPAPHRVQVRPCGGDEDPGEREVPGVRPEQPRGHGATHRRRHGQEEAGQDPGWGRGGG